MAVLLKTSSAENKNANENTLGLTLRKWEFAPQKKVLVNGKRKRAIVNPLLS
jgi:hypothetical protein